MRTGRLLALLSTAATMTLSARAAPAEDSPPPPAAGWWSAVDVSGRIEAGATMNPSSPDNGIDFGHLFTDKANQLVLNQFALTAERVPDSKTSGIDFGFKASAMYGMDSQFTHFQGLADHSTVSRNSFDLVEGFFDAHVAVLTPGGVDVKLGLFTTPLGYETIDPTGDFFYSKSYIFNYGLPLKHSGVLTTTHVNPVLDLYLGYTTGVNATFGVGGGYNDKEPHILGGFGLNLDRLTVLALTHIGPENPAGSLPAGVNIHHQLRYLNDVVVTWKVSDKLTSVTELNYIRDDGLKAEGGGVAEYLTYPLSRITTAGLRAEVWRDAQGVFVAGFPGNLDYLNAEEGLPNTSYVGGPVTYGALTLGLNIRPSHLPAMIDGLTVRPEVRYDRVLSSGSPFGGHPGTAKDQATIGLDVVIPLSFKSSGEAGGGKDGWDPTPPTSSDGGGSNADGPVTPDVAVVRQTAPLAGSTLVLAPDPAREPWPSTLLDVSGLAANVRIDRSAASPEGLNMTVRGLGAIDPQTGAGPAVDLIVDGVVVGGELARTLDGFTPRSIAIERGPSGVLEGTGALGGVIRIDRDKPTRAWGLELDYGLEQGYHADDERVVFNMPVGRTAGLELDAVHQRRGGYLNNTYLGDGLYGRDELTTGSLRFDWTPTPRLEADVGVTLTHQDGQGEPVALGDPLTAKLLAPTHPGLSFNGYGSPYLPGVTAPLGAFQVASDFPDRSRLTGQIYSLRLADDSAIGRFESLTAYVHSREDASQDLDGSCGGSDLGGRPCAVLANPMTGFLHTSRPRSSGRWSETLRFTHPFGRWASLETGLYYHHDDTSAERLTVGALSGATASSAPADQMARETTDSRAVFANLIVNLTGRLRASGGVRYLNEDIDYRQSVAGTPEATSGGSMHTNRVLTRFALEYRPIDGLTLHADRSTGYRVGGLSMDATLSERIPGQNNYDPAAPLANLSTYRPEGDTSYDIGARATMFGDQLTANLDGFINEVVDHQTTQVVLTPGYGPAIDTYVVNLPKVEIKGAELELQYRPRRLAGLTLSGNGGYQDGRIVNGRVPATEAAANVDGAAGSPGAIYDLTGTPLERTPKLNLGLRADYARRLGPGKMDVAVGYRWTDRYVFGDLAGQLDEQRAIGLVDFSVGYAWRAYRLSVTARNLTNEVYLTGAQPALFVHGWGDPRTVVVALQAKF